MNARQVATQKHLCLNCYGLSIVIEQNICSNTEDTQTREGRVMKNRHGVEYTFVKYDDNLYRFNMSEEGMKYSRYGGKEDQEGIDPNDLGFFDPSGGPFVAVGSKIYWDEIHEATKQEPLTVTRIMDRGAEGLFVEVE